MLGIQLTALSLPELRRLLEVARGRGQETLVRQLEDELAARRNRGVGQPQPISAQPLPPARWAAAGPQRRPTRPSRAPAIAVASVAAFVGAAIAWGVTSMPPQTSQPPAQPVVLAGSEAPPRVAVALTEVRLPEESPDQPISEPSAPGLDDPAPVRAAPSRPLAAGEHNPCYDLPTARERLVCGYPSLAIEDRRMKAALSRARANDTDPAAIDDEQAEWLAGSANISDRLVLAQRYARRVAELEAR